MLEFKLKITLSNPLPSVAIIVGADILLEVKTDQNFVCLYPYMKFHSFSDLCAVNNH